MNDFNFKNSHLRITALINKLNIEKTATIAGSFFLMFIIAFSLYSIIRKNQQRQLQSTASEFLVKSISSIANNWDYSETKSAYSDELIQNIENNNVRIFNSFSRLGKFVSSEEPVPLDANPAPANSDLIIKVSYKVLATFENGQALFLFNLIDQGGTPVINFINIDAVYYVYSAINTFDAETSFNDEDLDPDTRDGQPP